MNEQEKLKRQERRENKRLEGYICVHVRVYLKKNKTNENVRSFMKCSQDNKWCDGEKFHYTCYDRRDCIDE